MTDTGPCIFGKLSIANDIADCIERTNPSVRRLLVGAHDLTICTLVTLLRFHVSLGVERINRDGWSGRHVQVDRR